MSILRRGKELSLQVGSWGAVSFICQVKILAKVYFCIRLVKGTTPYPFFVSFSISMVPPASNGGVIVEFPFFVTAEAFYLYAIPPYSNVIRIVSKSSRAVGLYDCNDIRSLLIIKQLLVLEKKLQSEYLVIDDGLEAQRFTGWQAESVSLSVSIFLLIIEIDRHRLRRHFTSHLFQEPRPKLY